MSWGEKLLWSKELGEGLGRERQLIGRLVLS